MRVRVLAFARVAELLRGHEHELAFSQGSTVADVWERCCEQTAALRELAESTRFSRNGKIVDTRELLCDGDEIALLPPVGGG